MPTQLVAKPYGYQDWELSEPLPWEVNAGWLYDVAAMGRVWHLEALCVRSDGGLRPAARLRAQGCVMG